MPTPPLWCHKSSHRCKAPCALGRRQWLEGFVSDASVGHLSNHNATTRGCPAGIGSVMARSMSGLQGNTSASDSEFIAVYVTVPSAEAGKAIASKLISNKLAACVNMIPGIQSMYWWEGKVEVDEELLLMIKSRAQLFDALSNAVVEAHPYDVPEVIAVPIANGNKGYLDWLANSTGKDDA